MADSIDRVFGHALNTVNKIRPGSQKPPSSDRLALYGLYKQSMEGDVRAISDRPDNTTSTTLQHSTPDQLRKEQEKWDAWCDNEGLSRTEAKRRYVEKLIDTMHRYASQTEEAKQLVEELEFVWDQIKSNSQHSSSEHSSPLRRLGGYADEGGGGITSSAAALDPGGADTRPLRVLSPVSQADEEELGEEDEEFVDAPVSQVDPADLAHGVEGQDEGEGRPSFRRGQSSVNDGRWRKRVENSLFKMTTEIAALREQLENHRFIKHQRRKSLLGWVLRLGWWAVSFVVADAVVLWIVILYMRRKQDRRLEGAVRVLLGDAVAQVQKVASDVKLPRMPQIKGGKKNG